MILEIEDFFDNKLGAIQFLNNCDEYNNIINTNGPISIADCDTYDDIFDTNDFTIRIQLESINKDNIVSNIVDHIISTRSGQMYDEEIARNCIDDYLSDFTQELFEKIDDIMIKKYTGNDNLTII